MQTEILKITGMTCGGCTIKITRALKSMPGVGGINLSLTSENTTVLYDHKLTSVDQLKSAVKRAGYGVSTYNAMEKPQVQSSCYS